MKLWALSACVSALALLPGHVRCDDPSVAELRASFKHCLRPLSEFANAWGPEAMDERGGDFPLGDCVLRCKNGNFKWAALRNRRYCVCRADNLDVKKEEIALTDCDLRCTMESYASLYCGSSKPGGPYAVYQAIPDPTTTTPSPQAFIEESNKKVEAQIAALTQLIAGQQQQVQQQQAQQVSALQQSSGAVAVAVNAQGQVQQVQQVQQQVQQQAVQQAVSPLSAPESFLSKEAAVQALLASLSQAQQVQQQNQAQQAQAQVQQGGAGALAALLQVQQHKQAQSAQTQAGSDAQAAAKLERMREGLRLQAQQLENEARMLQLLADA